MDLAEFSCRTERWIVVRYLVFGVSTQEAFAGIRNALRVAFSTDRQSVAHLLRACTTPSRDLTHSQDASPRQQASVRLTDSQTESGLTGESEVVLKIECWSFWDPDSCCWHSNMPAFVPANRC